MNGALQKTTRVLVTHQLQFLSLASKIAVMSGGKITAFGTFEDLRGRVNFQAFTIAPPEDSGSEIPVDAPSDAPVERAESRLPESQVS